MKHTFTFFQKKQRSPEIVYCNQSERSKEEEFLLIDSDEQINVVANLIKSKITEIKNTYSSWPAPASEINAMCSSLESYIYFLKFFMVLDHAIYSNSLEILQNPNYTDLKQFINLKLGGFHVCLNFLAVIGTRIATTGMTYNN